MKVVREREVKFEIDDGVELGNLEGAMPGATSVESDERWLQATYYDTDDLRLARWGYTLRQRNDEGWLLKIPTGESSNTLSRSEVHLDADGNDPPYEATRLTAPLTRGAVLYGVATVRTHRRATQFKGNGATWAEVVDDRVDAEDATGHEQRFREIEVEIGDEAPADAVNALIERLERLGAHRGKGVPKLVRALGERASAPPDIVVPEVSAWPTAREVIHAAVATSVRDLVWHLPVAHLGDDPEGVHQARVALRRLRSDLRTFQQLVDPPWADDVRARVRPLADVLGAVRDDDVLLEALENLGADASITAIFEARRSAHRAALIATLDEPWVVDLLATLVGAAHDPPTAPQADDPAPAVLRPLIADRWRRLRRAVRNLGTTPTDAELHEVRIQVKRCRYAVSAAIPAFGQPCAKFAQALARVQDALGRLNDATTISAQLRESAVHVKPPVAFAAGRITGLLEARAEEQRVKWRRAWKRASTKELRQWL